jgi:sugar/nucleoside kinase (ribokinase family)
VRRLAVLGHVSRDVVGDGSPRIGGGPWYAARALRRLGRRAVIGAKCGRADRRRLLLRLEALGLPVVLTASGETTGFSFRYEGQHRVMHVDAVGDPWTPEEARAATERVDWVHVAALLRSDFPAETLAALAARCTVMLDGQGLVRPARVGPLVLDDDYDRDVLRHASILKLSEEEAVALAGSVEAVAELGVPEVVVTLGPDGCMIFDRGRVERVPAQSVTGPIDPTGAGDAFAATYLAARARGRSPALAAWRATALVSGLLMEPAP